MPDLKRRAVSAIDLFARLPPAEVDALASSAILRRYAPREDLFHEGEACDGIWLIAEGVVKIVKTTPSGRQVVLAMQEAPSTVAEVSIFDGGPYPATVSALESVQAMLILKKDFLALCRRNPDVTLNFLAVFGGRLRHLVALVERVTFGSVRQRLARTLLDFAGAAGSPRFLLPETQEELATRLGTVREVVSRNLGRFQAEGLLRMQRREVEILNRAGLEAEAETDF